MDIRRLLQGAALTVAAASLLSAQTAVPPSDWPMHGRDAGAQRFSPLKQINTENVSKLKLAWIYDTPAEIPPPASEDGANAENAPAAGAAGENAPSPPQNSVRPSP